MVIGGKKARGMGDGREDGGWFKNKSWSGLCKAMLRLACHYPSTWMACHPFQGSVSSGVSWDGTK